MITIDFCGPISKSSRVKYILVCTDVFTKAVHLCFECNSIVRPTGKAVLKIIGNTYISRYAKMKQILSDQGMQFQSEVWYWRLTENDILTSIRHPQGKGFCPEG